MNDHSSSDPAKKPTLPTPVIRVIGLGGAGNNAMDRLALDGAAALDLIAVDADVQVLAASVATRRIQLGKATTRGLGAGGDPEVGYEATAEAVEEIKAAVETADLVFLCTGLGGGTGSGGGPAIASIARQCGARVIAMVTMPFGFEGRRRRKQAEQALESLREHADLVIGFENDRLGDHVAPTAGINQAFAAADQTLSVSIRAISSMLRKPGLIHLSMADVIRAAAGGGASCLFGFGEADGDNRVHDALARALKSPLMDKGRILDEAGSVLVHVMGGNSMTFAEVEILMRELGRHLADHATISFGVAVEPKLGNKMSIAILSALGSSSPARECLPPARPERNLQVAPRETPPASAAEPPPVSSPAVPRRTPAREVAPEAAPEMPAVPTGERPDAPVAPSLPEPVPEPVPRSAPEPDQPVKVAARKAEPGPDLPTEGPLPAVTDGSEGVPARKEPLPEPPAPAAAPADLPLVHVEAKAKSRSEAQAAKLREERQEQLMFEPISRGRFDKSEPTIVDGQDLDVPTFLRMNIKVK